jgi:hypothetical protein
MKKGTLTTLLAIYLILAGILMLAPQIPYLNYVTAVLAIVSGILYLISR